MMPDERALDPSERLETVFKRIAATRMAGVGLLNPVLAVEAVGFRSWNDKWVGVLVTPWFMSLICLPSQPSSWEDPCSGCARDLELPAGTYEFLTAHEEELGPYLTSSLFSPMFEFQDMDQAREAAAAVLEEVFTPVPPTAPTPQAGLAAKLEQPASRRGFLGALLGNGEKS
jgi:[NiFe] hydrogenase assembly HybE family chaperone